MKNKLSAPFIKNIDEYKEYKNEHDALQILEAGYQAIRIEQLIQEIVVVENNTLYISDDVEISLDDVDRIFVYCIGKCAPHCGPILEKFYQINYTQGCRMG